MESINKWAGMMCFAFATVSLQVPAFVKFVIDHPLVLPDLVLLALLGTFGQVFIFYTIFNFSPLFLSIVTTTRKFFTVLVSIVIYKHPVNTTQWLSIGLVFVGVTIEMLSGDKKKDHGKTYEKLETTQVKVDTEHDSSITKRAVQETGGKAD